MPTPMGPIHMCAVAYHRWHVYVFYSRPLYMYFSIATGNLSGTIFLIRIPGFILVPSAHFGPSALAAYVLLQSGARLVVFVSYPEKCKATIDTKFAFAVTSSADHPPRRLTCVCFAKPSSLGVPKSFLTQKQPF